jgi:chromosome segregation ATPase
MKLERDNLLEVQKSLEQKFRAVNAELVESKSTCTVLQANVQAAEDKMGLQDELNIELNAKVNALSKRLADKGAELDEREAEWQQLKHDFEKRYSELQDLRKRAEEQLEATLTQVKDAGDEAAQLMVELREVRTRADDFAGRWSESCVELSRVEAENNALNVTHDAMKQEVWC